jgi:hypothetical protein
LQQVAAVSPIPAPGCYRIIAYQGFKSTTWSGGRRYSMTSPQEIVLNQPALAGQTDNSSIIHQLEQVAMPVMILTARA